MKKIQLALAISFAILSTTACNDNNKCVHGNGGYSQKNYSVSSFNEISLEGDAEMVITQDSIRSVRVEAQSNVLEVLNVDVANGELRIGHNNCFKNSKTLKVYVSTPDLQGVELSGSGNVNGIGRFSSSNFRADISGSADMNLNISCDVLSADISGSGTMRFDGTATLQFIDISGSGNMYCFGLSGKQADVRISGSGNTEVNVSDKLDVKISGSGNVYYKGQPAINSNISGSGNLIHKP